MGGGITGALVAWQLIQAGVECVVIDSRSIGQGSTCASTSLLQYEIDTPLSELIHVVGERHALRSYQLCLDSIYQLQAIAKQIGLQEFQMKESLYFAAKKGDMRFLHEEYAMRKQHNFPVSMLEAGEITTMFGFSAPGGIFSGVAAQTNAYMMNHFLHQDAIRQGLRVFDRTNAVQIEHHPRSVRLRTELGHEIRARWLVYATGYEVIQYLRNNIVDLHSTYAVAGEQPNQPQEYWHNNALLWNTADPYLYCRTTASGRLIIGGRDEKFYNPTRRDRLINRKAKQLCKDFRQLFPDIEFRQEFTWCGTFGATQDGLPFIGRYRPLPNSLFALGFGGNGITFSMIAAHILADIVCGKKNTDAEIFRFERV